MKDIPLFVFVGAVAAVGTGIVLGTSPLLILLHVLIAAAISGLVGLSVPDDDSMSFDDLDSVIQIVKFSAPDWIEAKGLEVLDKLTQSYDSDPQNRQARWLDQLVVTVQQFTEGYPEQARVGLDSALLEKLPPNVRDWIEARTGGTWLAAK